MIAATLATVAISLNSPTATSTDFFENRTVYVTQPAIRSREPWADRFEHLDRIIEDFREALETITPGAAGSTPGMLQAAPELRIEVVKAVLRDHVAERRVAWFVARQGGHRERKPLRRRLRAWERES